MSAKVKVELIYLVIVVGVASPSARVLRTQSWGPKSSVRAQFRTRRQGASALSSGSGSGSGALLRQRDEFRLVSSLEDGNNFKQQFLKDVFLSKINKTFCSKPVCFQCLVTPSWNVVPRGTISISSPFCLFFRGTMTLSPSRDRFHFLNQFLTFILRRTNAATNLSLNQTYLHFSSLQRRATIKYLQVQL